MTHQGTPHEFPSEFMQQPERSFFWHVLSPDSAQFKRGTGMLEMFSRFVTVGLGMFARLHVIFKPARNNFILRFFVHVLYFN